MESKLILQQFSWSAFELYQQCPFKFYQNYVLGKKEPSNIFALYGCAIHNLLDQLYKKEQFTLRYAYSVWENILLKEYKTEWKQYQYGHIPLKEVMYVKSQGFKQIDDFFELAIEENILKPAIFTEQTIKGNYGQHKIVAKIDIGINTKYGLTLLDWKTGKPDKKSFIQLVLYAAIYQKI